MAKPQWTRSRSPGDDSRKMRPEVRGGSVGKFTLGVAPGVDDDELLPPDSGDGMSARRIPAGEIRKLLLEPGLITDPQGLMIRGALITGALDFDHAKLPCRLVFVHCRFEQKPSFVMATLPALVLRGVAGASHRLRTARLRGLPALTGRRAPARLPRREA